MAEILSGLPCSGGPYFWASWLAGRHGPIFSWVTGWFNLLGQISVTASISSALMSLIRSVVSLTSDHAFTPAEDLAVYAGVQGCAFPCLMLAPPSALLSSMLAWLSLSCLQAFVDACPWSGRGNVSRNWTLQYVSPTCIVQLIFAEDYNAVLPGKVKF